jgi:dinuclear metal center YbgI/SA1388 family protein
MKAKDVAEYLNKLLRLELMPDYPGAHNGLQVDSEGDIERVGFSVDATLASIEAAVARGANLLVVHHGLFWDGGGSITGRRYRRLRSLIRSDVALYSAHLPLDVHPDVGNNAVLAREIGVEIQGSFGEYKGLPVGVYGKLEIRREALAARLDELLGGRVRMIAGGPERINSVGVITGAAGSQVLAAQAMGLDAFITGEGAHQNYFDAIEGGVNLYFGGHYATETWGVRALASRMKNDLGLETFFIDQPTGL